MLPENRPENREPDAWPPDDDATDHDEPGTETWVEAGIAMVRASKELGPGSCSIFAECYSDEELAEDIEASVASGSYDKQQTPLGLLRFCLEWEADRREREDEQNAARKQRWLDSF